MSGPLELDGAALRALLRSTGDRLAAWLDRLPEQPASSLRGSRKAARAFDEPVPEEGEPYERLLGRLLDRAVPASLNTAHPGYLGFIPGGGLVQGGLAELIAAVTNRYTGLWMPAPALVQAEISVIRWLCAEVGYGAAAGGVLLSGGSIANLTALVAAREDRLGEDFAGGVLYVTEQTHHCVRKAARTAGFPRSAVRELPTDAGFRMRGDVLRAAVAEDRAAGLRPFCVVASAGSTAVGAVDPLDELAEVSSAEGLWLHVDGAYGGAFALTGRGKATLRGLERADSIVLDPHKGFFLHYGTGALLVKDRERLRAAFTEPSAYLPQGSEDADRWDFADLSPELSRPARGLRLWLPLKMHGMRAFRDALDEKLDLAREAAERVAALPGVRLVSPPTLSLFAFRVEPEGVPEEELDALNRRVAARVNDRGRVFITGAVVPEGGTPRFVLRVCVLSFRTHRAEVDALVEDLGAAVGAAALD